jgi:hypothetical protein
MDVCSKICKITTADQVSRVYGIVIENKIFNDHITNSGNKIATVIKVTITAAAPAVEMALSKFRFMVHLYD